MMKKGHLFILLPCLLIAVPTFGAASSSCGFPNSSTCDTLPANIPSSAKGKELFSKAVLKVGTSTLLKLAGSFSPADCVAGDGVNVAFELEKALCLSAQAMSDVSCTSSFDGGHCTGSDSATVTHTCCTNTTSTGTCFGSSDGFTLTFNPTSAGGAKLEVLERSGVTLKSLVHKSRGKLVIDALDTLNVFPILSAPSPTGTVTITLNLVEPGPDPSASFPVAGKTQAEIAAALTSTLLGLGFPGVRSVDADLVWAKEVSEFPELFTGVFGEKFVHIPALLNPNGKTLIDISIEVPPTLEFTVENAVLPSHVVPTLSTWGIIVLAGIMLAGVLLMARKRRLGPSRA